MQVSRTGPGLVGVTGYLLHSTWMLGYELHLRPLSQSILTQHLSWTHVLGSPQSCLSELGVAASQDSNFHPSTRDVPSGWGDGIFLSGFAE